MTATDLPQGWTWEDVVARLGAHVDLEDSARASGAIRRTRVIKTGAQLLRLVLAYALSGLSLRATAAWAEAGGHASFSDVALLKRLRRCGPWLADLVGHLGAAAHPEASCMPEGRRIVAVDASAICSPGNRKDYRVLHTVYDVTAQRFLTTEVTDRHTAERLDVGGVAAGEIRLGDRGYARFRDLSAVAAAGADYVVRLSATALKLTAEAKRLDRAALCRRAERDGIQDVPVTVQDGKSQAQFDARVILLALPPQKAEAARRAMRRNAQRWGYSPSEDALATAGCLMLITSLPAALWPAERILALYRRRWQVELAFKRLKSLIGLERLRVYDAALVSAWIHAILLVALLIDLERPSHPEAPDSPPWPPDNAGPFPSGAISPWPCAL